MTNQPKSYKQLCVFVNENIGYEGNPNLIGTMHDSIFKDGKRHNVSVNLQSLADFFDDNPGAIDTVVEWCEEHYPEKFEDNDDEEFEDDSEEVESE